eukprot:2254778-Karenia_brevis.AAC.1
MDFLRGAFNDSHGSMGYWALRSLLRSKHGVSFAVGTGQRLLSHLRTGSMNRRRPLKLLESVMQWVSRGVEILSQDPSMSLDNFMQAMTTTFDVTVVYEDHAQELYLR